MVLTLLKGLGKAYLKSQKSAIKGVKPGTNLGGKTIAEWQLKAAKAKKEAAKFNLQQTLKETDKTFDKLEKTLEKQKKILDD